METPFWLRRESFKNNVGRFTGILSSCIYPDNISKFPIEEDKLFEGSPHEDLFSYSYAKRCLAIQIDMYNKKYKNYINKYYSDAKIIIS